MAYKFIGQRTFKFCVRPFGTTSASAFRYETPNYSSGSTSDLTKYKRGRGGRSSFNGNVCTIFGCSGFVAPYVVNDLAKQGTQIIAMFREDPTNVRYTKPLGDLGQIIQLPFEISDVESVRRAVKYSNIVINLLGKERESLNYTYDDVHVKWSRLLARVCREMNVQTLLHVSSLNALPTIPEFFLEGGSKWLKTKYESEVAVREEFPDAIIFKCSDIYGWGDHYLNHYKSRWRHIIPFTATTEVYKKGNETEKQPVYINDVCKGISAAVLNPKLSTGQTYEIIGPYRYNLGQLLDFFYSCMRRDVDEYAKTFASRYRRIEPTFMMRAKCTISDKFHYLPWHPFQACYWEKLERESMSDVVNAYAFGLEDLGVTNLTNIEHRAIYELRQAREGMDYGAEEDSGIIDPLDLEGKYPPRLRLKHIQHV